MGRFVIVGTADSGGSGTDPFASRAGEPERVGCAWLFEATARVEDVERALRAAIAEYFRSGEGARVRRGEGLERIGWCDAIPWIPDELWERHGLRVFRHPDVERILLDEEEDLGEELPPAGATAASAPPGSLVTWRGGRT